VTAGTRLWRVHSGDNDVTRFPDGDDDDPNSAGRFNGAGQPYTCAYASTDLVTTLAERFFDRTSVDSAGIRTIPRSALAAQALSAVVTTTDLTLLRLTGGPDLAAIGLDDWVITAGPDDYERTQACAEWLHDTITSIQGITWLSSDNFPRQTLALFSDRCGPEVWQATGTKSRALDDLDGAGWLNDVLAPHRVRVPPPEDESTPPIFVNYRTGDSKHAAMDLHRELVRRLGPASVFLDDLMPPSTVFPPRLIKAVRQCKALVAVIGERWEKTYDSTGRRLLDQENDWVRTEIATALACGVRIFPVMVGLRGKLEAADLPADLEGLADVQLSHLRHGYTAEDVRNLVDELIRAVPTLASLETHPDDDPP
jgi:hypothetical protein